MIDVAYAQAAGGEGGGPLVFLLQFLPFILVFVIFYFLLIRPQSQRQKALQAMIKNLKRGDKVVTSGGLKGSVVDIKLTIEQGVVVAKGEVRWANRPEEEPIEQPAAPGLGISFIEVNGGQDLLSRFVQRSAIDAAN